MLRLPEATRAFQYVGVDWFQVSGGSKWLCIVDYYSNVVFSYEASRTDHKGFTKLMKKHFISTCVPDILFSDGGPPFDSAEVRKFMDEWGIKHVLSTAEYPQGNSRSELAVKSAKGLIKKCTRNGRFDDDKWIKGILEMRNTPDPNTGVSPAMKLYGHPIQTFLPAHRSTFDKDWHKVIREAEIVKEKRKQAVESITTEVQEVCRIWQSEQRSQCTTSNQGSGIDTELSSRLSRIDGIQSG